jgi:hypothetical protein
MIDLPADRPSRDRHHQFSLNDWNQPMEKTQLLTVGRNDSLGIIVDGIQCRQK